MRGIMAASNHWGLTMKTVLAVYCFVYSAFIIISTILMIGEPMRPIQPWEGLVTIAMTIPLIFLGILVIRKK